MCTARREQARRMRGAGARLVLQQRVDHADHLPIRRPRDVGEVLRRDVEAAQWAPGTCLYDRDSVPEVPPLGDRHHPARGEGAEGRMMRGGREDVGWAAEAVHRPSGLKHSPALGNFGNRM